MPLAFWFIKELQSKIVEVGAVTPYYFKCTHPVYDLFDTHPLVIKKDAITLDVTGKNVLSISTIEHFGTGDYNQEKQKRKGVDFLLHVIDASNKFLISWPLGYDMELDNFAFETNQCNYISRCESGWSQISHSELSPKGKVYGPNWANSIALFENIFN